MVLGEDFAAVSYLVNDVIVRENAKLILKGAATLQCDLFNLISPFENDCGVPFSDDVIFRVRIYTIGRLLVFFHCIDWRLHTVNIFIYNYSDEKPY